MTFHPDQPFRPGWWLPGGHMQTLWPALARRRIPLRDRPERLELPDGDFLDLQWVGERGPIVLVLHGLQGSIHSPYARGLLHEIDRRGWRGALMHFRGCGCEPNRLPRGYHSGETGDLHHVLAELRRREPRTPLAAVGYSLGGNVLLKWLGEEAGRAPLAAAAAVSVPYDLGGCADHINRGFSRVYQRHLVGSMVRALRVKMERIPLGLPLGPTDLTGLRTFRDFDHRVTAPLHGFDGAADYYARSSSRQWLGRIAVPTLLLHAEDDPFMPPSVIPTAGEISDAVRIEVSRGGGHVGFVTGAGPWNPTYWLEHRIPHFLAEQFNRVQ